MWDKIDIRIPFKHDFVLEVQPMADGQPVGFVEPKNYGFDYSGTITVTNTGEIEHTFAAQHWDTISSSISDTAIGFMPSGKGFYPWPHISIKASPSKVVQGHNVFGSENIRAGVMQMLSNLALAFPDISEHLDMAYAEVRWLDSTYSAFVPIPYQRKQVLIAFEGMAPNKNAINKHTGYLQFNTTSEYRKQKIYYKAQELAADFELAAKTGKKEKAAILGDKKLHDFADGRMRFEATTGSRALQEMGIPTLLNEFLKFHDWFEEVHKEPLCRYLWHKAFDKYFAQLKGHSMKNVDDNSIKLKIQMKFDVPKSNLKTGKVVVCRRKSNALWNTYRSIKAEGYDQLAKENSSTFFRNVGHLVDAGLSRAFLKSLDPYRPNENVVALVQIVNVDFSQQRPSWYCEPVSGFEDKRRHLRVVA